MENNFHRQPRSGWNSRENELLAQQVRQAKGARLPLRTAFEACTMDGKVTVYSMAEYLNLKPDTVRRRLKSDGGFWIDGTSVGLKEPGSNG